MGREIAAEEVANDDQSRKGVNSSNGNVCHCHNLIFRSRAFIGVYF